jgi:Na+-transporting NADH:ubiquinone oxidoreductase subunit C
MLNESTKAGPFVKFTTALENNASYQKFIAYRDKVLGMGNDSLEKTIAIAVSLCLFCAVLVSFGAVGLKPLQNYNKAFDMKKNILEVAGLMDDSVDVDKTFAEKIEPKMVDLATGEYVDNVAPDSYDQRKAAKDPAQSMPIPKSEDIAHIRTKPKLAKVYLVKQGDGIKSIILPISGYGLWSTLYGFLAVEPDGQTIQSINFYEQAETPGLGGEVVNPKWQALWRGKKIYAETDQPSMEKGIIEEADIGEPAITLVKGVVDDSKAGAKYQVDGLAGATLTSNGVTNLVRYWMSKDGFARYLTKVKSSQEAKS